MSRLTLVRHGESEWNVTGRVQGQSLLAGTLTASGEHQAVASARELRRAGVVASLVVTSDLPRALDTATIIGRELRLPIEMDPRLREQHLGGFEGLALDAPYEDGTIFEAVSQLWREPTEEREGAESVAALQARVQTSVVFWARELGDHGGVTVTHGGPIRALRAIEHPEFLASGRALVVHNGSLTELEITGDDVRILDVASC